MIGGVLKECFFPSAGEECIFSGTTLCELFEIWKINKKSTSKIGPQCILVSLSSLLFHSVGVCFLKVSIWEFNCYK